MYIYITIIFDCGIALKTSYKNFLFPQMRRFKQTEGLVLYYLMKDKTIGLTKVKTIWYIIVRTIREKIKCNFSNKKKKPLSHRIKEIKTRLEEIQKWLGFCDKCLEKWKVCSFCFHY